MLNRNLLGVCFGLLMLSATACSDDGGGAAEDDGSEMGDPPSDMSSGAASVTPEDLGKGDGSDVITIGDSWMSLGPASGIQVSLEKLSGQDYRTYGVGGTRLLNEVIPMQYEAAKAENPDIKTVIMTGGGNDILQDPAVLFTCSDQNIDNQPACKRRIDEVAVRLEKLWAEMAADGVRDVVVIGYSRKASLLGSLKKSVEYSGEKIMPICMSVPEPLRCHSVDSDMIVPDLMLRDGIHPNDAGYDAIAKGVLELMEEEGMRR